MTPCIALIRGINVGRTKRMAMADLRAMFEGMGHSKPQTLLNSGNVVFLTQRPKLRDLTLSIEAQITRRFGFSAAVVVLTAHDLDRIVDENPLPAAAEDPSRHLVAFVSDAVTLSKAQPLLDGAWAPERFALGPGAAYLGCPDGVIPSKLVPIFTRLTADAATTRNWATVLNLQAAAAKLGPASRLRSSGGQLRGSTAARWRRRKTVKRSSCWRPFPTTATSRSGATAKTRRAATGRSCATCWRRQAHSSSDAVPARMAPHDL